MSAVSQRVKGLEALRRRLQALPAAAATAAGPGFEALAEEVADEVRASLGTVAGPSAPGAVPDDLSGLLAASVSAGATVTGSTVAVTAPEARFLEYGTIRMAPRPFLRPVALKAGPTAVALLAAALRQGLRP